MKPKSGFEYFDYFAGLDTFIKSFNSKTAYVVLALACIGTFVHSSETQSTDSKTEIANRLTSSSDSTNSNSQKDNIYSSAMNMSSSIEINKTVSDPTPPTGEIFSYVIQYRCASTIENCMGVVISDPLPPEIEYVGLVGSPHTISETYDSGTRTVTFTFDNALTAGSTGEVQIFARYPNGITPNGTTAINTATISATNATSSSASVSNTAYASAKIDFEKYIAAGGAAGGNMTYGFRVCNIDDSGIPKDSTLSLENITIIDTLPAGTTLLQTNLTGGSIIYYDPIENIIEFSVIDLEPGKCKYPRLTLSFPDPPFDVGDLISNTGNLNLTPVGEGDTVLSSTIKEPLLPPYPAITLSTKESSHVNRLQGEFGSYQLDFEVNGTEPLDDLCMVDTIPDGIEITRIFHGGYYFGGLDAGDDVATISYTTNLNGPTVIPGSPFHRYHVTGSVIDVEDDLGLVQGGSEYITSISWCFGDVPAGFGTFEKVILEYQVKSDASVGFVTNCMEFTTSTPGTILNEPCVNLEIRENTNGAIANPLKAILNVPASGFYNPGDTVLYKIRALNDPAASEALIEPVLLDLLPDHLEYVPGSWYIPSWSQTLSSDPIFTEIENFNSTGRTLLSWAWEGASSAQISPNQEVNIYFEAVLAENAPSGEASIENKLYLAHQEDGGCYHTLEADIYDLNSNGDTSESLCFFSQFLNINALVSLESEKLVKGQSDSTFTKYPKTGTSMPGGVADYVLEVRNLGNVAFDSIVVIDIFPHIGDYGVISALPRQSRWQPNLVATVNTPSGVTVYYSTSANPCRSEEGIHPAGPPSCDPPNWSTAPPLDLTTVRSLKFEFGSTVLEPSDTFRLSWPMRVPVNVFSTIGAAPDSIAWNSFGYTARRVDNSQFILPAEPLKVGLTIDELSNNIYGDYVWNDVNQDGIQGLGESGINGVRVELYKDNGDGIIDVAVDTFINFTLTANGGFYLFPDLEDGDYYSVFYVPPDMEITNNDIGIDDTIDSDGIASTTSGFDIAVSPITNLTAPEHTWDLGLHESPNASVGDYVWFDINANGIQDESIAEGINGVLVNIYDNANPGITVATTVTSNDIIGNPGYYLFNDLPPADYFIEFVLPNGTAFSTTGPIGGSDPNDSDADTTTGQTEVFTLIAGQYDNSWDAASILSDTEVCDNGIDDDGDGLTDCEDCLICDTGIAPIITDVPSDTTINCGSPPPVASSVMVTDDCDPNVNVVLYETSTDVSLNCPENYQIIRTWIATDACGNSSTAQQIISIVDTIAPVIVTDIPTSTLSCNMPNDYPNLDCPALEDIACDQVISSGTVNLMNNTSYCITGNVTISGDIQNNTQIYISPGAIVNCMNVNVVDGFIINCGVFNQGSSNLGGTTSFTLHNYGIFNSGNSGLIVENDTLINYSSGEINISGVFNFSDNSVLHNYGDVFHNSIGGNLRYASGASIYNHSGGLISSEGNQVIDRGAVLKNEGFVLAKEDLNINTGSDVSNCCTFHVYNRIIINGEFTNDGLMLVDDPHSPYQNGFEQIVINRNFANNGEVIGGEFLNNSNTTGDAGIFVFEGATNNNGRFSGSNPLNPLSFSDVSDTGRSFPKVQADLFDFGGNYRASDNSFVNSVKGNHEITADIHENIIVNQNCSHFQILDCDSPNANCETDLYLICNQPENDDKIQSWLDSNAGVEATDNCTQVIWSNDFVGYSNECDTIGILVTFVAEDECGNSSSISARIIIKDNAEPLILDNPIDTTITCGGTPPAAATITAIDNCDPNLSVVLSETSTNNNPTCLDDYEITRTWTVTDACGNSSVAEQVITVEGDSELPVLVDVPADVTYECSAVPAFTDPVSAIDNCDAVVDITFSETTNLTACAESYSIERTWTATDDCGNTAVATQTVTVLDRTGPIMGGISSDTIITCGGTPPAAATITAIDNCDPNVSVVLSETSTNNNPTCLDDYEITRTWTATDACGNSSVAEQIITVEGDSELPVLVDVPADETYECSAVPTFTDPVSAIDNCDAVVDITFSETTNLTACAESYSIERTWTATDDCGNTAVATQTVTVLDRIGPIMGGVPSDVTITCGGSPPAAATITATDNCDPNVSVVLSETSTNNNPTCLDDYEITRTWTATDACGNSSVAEQIITVEGDSEQPVLVDVPADETYECSAVPTFTDPVSAIDNCDAVVDITFSETTNLTACAESYSIERTWTATDDCGNTIVATQTVMVLDRTGPIMGSIPSDVTVTCGGTPPAAATITATDNCDPNVSVVLSETSTNNNPTCLDDYEITRTWTATDACGNSSVAEQIITVEGDSEQPVLVDVPADETYECSAVPTFTDPVSAIDNCDAVVDITFSETTNLTACAESYSIERTWTATDDCGNTAVATQTVMVLDRTGPIMGGIPSDVTVTCGGTPPAAATITATDNCDPNVSVVLSETSTNNNPTCLDDYEITRTWTATDACGNSSVAEQIITVEGDSELPVLVDVPADETYECSAVPTFTDPVSAIDNCDAVVDITFSETTNLTACAESYSIERTWTATDDCGNTAVATQTVTVLDRIGPIMGGVPSDVTITCGGSPPAAATITATDNCDPNVSVVLSETSTNNNPTCLDDYEITRTWTATDACGNSSVAEQIITVEGDSEQPVLVDVPADETYECSAVPTFTDPVSAIDNCDAVVDITFSETTNLTACAESYSIERTWTATDDCGNTIVATQTVMVLDRTGPIMGSIPSDVTVTCGGTPPAAATITATDNCDPNVSVVLSETSTNNNPTCLDDYEITRTWTATDACGNSSVAEQIITVEGDSEQPVLVDVPADETYECSAVPTFTDPVSAIDNCDAVVDITFSETTNLTACAESYSIERTWTATDDCGNTIVATQTVTVLDRIGPIMGGVPSDVTVTCGGSPPAAATITATDNCDPNVSVILSETSTNNNPTCLDDYEITRTWTATDACGNSSVAEQIITVEGDSELPVLVDVPADETYECSAVPTFTDPVSAIDNCDAVVDITFSETTNLTACAESYSIERTWTATDDCGNTAVATQTVTVLDRIGPIMGGVPSDVTITCGGSPPAAATITATDNCDPNVSVILSETSTNNNPACLDDYEITRTWTATDACGNSSVAEQIITVEGDSELPVLVDVPADETYECSAVPTFTDPVSAIDNCDAVVDITFSETTNLTACAESYSIERTWTATDDCGNTAVATQTVMVLDRTGPIMSGVPSNITVTCGGTPPAAATITATDNCDPNVSVVLSETSTNNNPTCLDDYEITRTWTATDACGNSSVAEQVVTVEGDSELPVLVDVPADETYECSAVPAFTDPVSAIDNCDAVVDITFSETTNLTACAESYSIERTWIATDDCGNTAVATQTVTVLDRTGPIMGGIPSDITVTCGGTPPAAVTITATDNCDPNVSVVLSETSTNNNPTCLDDYEITRTWKATDACGNSSVAEQIITVEGDSELPVLVDVPADETYECSALPEFTNPVSATDNCDAAVEITLNETTIPTACAQSYSIERIWTAVDDCGNTAVATQTVTVLDRIGPIMSGVPSDVTITCGGSPPAAATITATDNCDPNVSVILSETSTNNNPACLDDYEITRTWTATDACGNSSVAEQIITVEGDSELPVLVDVPADETYECSAVPTFTDPVSAIDNCDAVVDITFSETTNLTACAESYSIERTWTATDDCGNTAVATQTVMVLDRTGPIMSGVPSNITVTCDGTPPAAATITATDNCDPNVSVVLSETSTNNNPTCLDDYEITRTWTATDACGNSSVAEQIITVEGDSELPVLVDVPADETYECSALPEFTNPVSATDNCDAAVEITLNETTIPTACAQSYSIERIWTAVDDCGNSSVASQTVIVQDTNSPLMSGVPTDITIICGEIPPDAETVIATDNCDPNVSVVLSETSTNNNPTCLDDYEITRTWTATDACGNSSVAEQIITVEGDSELPVLVDVPADETYECSAVPTFTDPVTAIDNCDAVVDITFSEITNVTACAESYSIDRTWTATDDCGNTAVATQTVMVLDRTGPIMGGMPSDVTVTCGGTPPAAATITATDNCDPNVSVVLSETSTNNNPTCLDDYEITRTWTATDACGNSSVAEQIITVEGDSELPVLVDVPADETYECSAVPVFTDPVTAIDNCDAVVDITFSEITNVTACAESYSIERTWTATDDCGNTAVATQTVMVLDRTGPIMGGIPSDVTVTCGGTPPAAATITATDNCDPNVSVVLSETSTNNNPTCLDDYEITRTWTATDACGNSSVAEQIITVEGDSELPVLVDVPADETYECSAVPTFTDPVTAIDNCDAVVDITFSETTNLTACAESYSIDRTWTATDDCGNTAVATQTVMVLDRTGPIMGGMPSDVTVTCGGTPPAAATITATDNCDPNVSVVLSETSTNNNPTCLDDYEITRTWTATDACGNSSVAEQIITVEGDSELPVLVDVPADETYECSALPEFTNPVSATDNCDAAVEITLNETTIPTACAQSYSIERIWTAVDDCGNSSVASQTVIVEDTNSPLMSGVPSDIIIDCGEIPPVAVSILATDNCDPNAIVVLSETSTNDNPTCADDYEITRTWTATDACGNSSVVQQIITVGGDSELPVLMDVPADITITCGQLPPPAEMLSATDNCDSDISVELTEVSSNSNPSCTDDYQITRIWTATDACGNSSIVQQLVTVQGDSIAPVLSANFNDITVNCVEDVSDIPQVFATDACDSNISVEFSEERLSGNCVNSFTLIRTWTATDPCGNSTSTTQSIFVEDNEAPIITGVPIDISSQCNDSLDFSMPEVRVTDNCDPNVALQFEELSVPNGCAGGFDITRTWIAEDACGNISTKTQNITVGDTEAPTFSFIPENLTIACGGLLEQGSPNVTDNCDSLSNVIFNEEIIDGDCPNSYTIIRTWSSTDACGNLAEVTQNIQVGDNTPPLFLDTVEDVTVNLVNSDAIPPVEEISAFDICSGEIQVEVEEQAGEGCSYEIVRTYTATDECANSSVLQQIVTVNDNFKVDIIHEAVSICTNEFLEFTVSVIDSTYEYTWTSNGGEILNAQNNTVLFSADQSGSYNISMTADNGTCTSISTVEIQVSDPSTIQITNDSIVCIGDTIDIEVTGGLSYAWSGPNDFASNDSIIQIANANIENSGIYFVSAITLSGCTQVYVVEILVEDMLNISASSSEPICQGGALTLFAEGGTSYEWTGPNGWSSNEQNPAIRNLDLDTGIYFFEVLVSSFSGCSAREVLQVEVLDSGDITVSDDVTVCIGDRFDLGANGGVSYSWIGPNGFTSENQFIELVASAENAGTFQLTIISDSDCIIEKEVAVTMEDCDCNTGATIALTTDENCDDHDGVAVFTPSDFTYLWPDSTMASLRDDLSKGTYTITVTDFQGCQEMLTITIDRVVDENCDTQFQVGVDTIYTTTMLGEPVIICLDTSLLSGTINSFTECSPSIYGMYSLEEEYCFIYTPSEDATISDLEAFCLELCDDQGECIKTTIIINFTMPCQQQSDIISDQEVILQSFDCVSEAVFCLDIPFSMIDSFIYADNGAQFERTRGCSYDSLYFYSYITIPAQGADGPYVLEAWNVNEESYSGQFDSLSELISLMNTWDEFGNWQIDSTSFTVYGGSSQNNYGKLIVSKINTGEKTILDNNSRFVPFAIALDLDIGEHEIILTDKNTGCSDTVHVLVQCTDVVITPDTINLYLEIGQDTSICLDQSELTAGLSTISNYCEDFSTDVVSYDIVESCINIKAEFLGDDIGCFVYCDENDFCDTLVIFSIVVIEGSLSSPIAMDDDTITLMNWQVSNFEITKNDTFNILTDSIVIVSGPENGEISISSDFTIDYIPNPGFCGEVDVFEYMIIGPSGTNNAKVYIDVLCEDLTIFNGFSPNGDGLNDTFTISGIELFPDNKVIIFNRWGNQVFYQQAYQNDWQGTWLDRPLPDGTYFYIVDDGAGNRYSGYLQINR